MKTRLILLLASLSIAVLAFVWMAPAGTGQDLTIPTIDAEAAHQAQQNDQLTIIDIRRPDEWRRTGLAAGAVPIDMRSADFVERLAETLSDDINAPFAVICARGVRSNRLARQLGAAGFTNVMDISEGMLGSRAGPGWLARDLPIMTYPAEGG